jgi:hypothetical protein
LNTHLVNSLTQASNMDVQSQSWKENAHRCADLIKEGRKPYEDSHTKHLDHLHILKSYNSMFTNLTKTLPIRDLPIGSYPIVALKQYYGRVIGYGNGTKMLLILDIDGQGDLAVCFHGQFINRITDIIPVDKIKKMWDTRYRFLSSYQKNIGRLHFTTTAPERKPLEWSIELVPDLEKDCIRQQIRDSQTEIAMCDENLSMVPVRLGYWNDESALRHAALISKARQPLETSLSEQNTQLTALREYNSAFSKLRALHTQDLSQGTYTIVALKEYTGKLMCGDKGKKILFVIDLDGKGDIVVCFDWFFMLDVYEKYPRKTLKQMWDPKYKLVSSLEKNIGTLTIGNEYDDCSLTDWSVSGGEIWRIDLHKDLKKKSIKQQITTKKAEITRCEEKLSVIPFEVTDTEYEALPKISMDSIQDTTLPSLAVLPKKSIHTIIGAHDIVTKTGEEDMVVELEDGSRFVGGEDLVKKKDLLSKECRVSIEKVKGGKRKTSYAVVKTGRKREWGALVDYKSATMLPSKRLRMKVKVIDTSVVVNKGQKRKLILDDNGDVYRFKKSKLEEKVKPNDLV